MGSAILDAFRTTRIAIKEHGWENARPTSLRERGHAEKYPITSQERYTDQYVGDVRTGLKSCKVCHVGLMLVNTSSNLQRTDVPFLPLLLYMLEPDVEQPDLTSWYHGTSWHAQRPPPESRPDRSVHFHTASR